MTPKLLCSGSLFLSGSSLSSLFSYGSLFLSGNFFLFLGLAGSTAGLSLSSLFALLLGSLLVGFLGIALIQTLGNSGAASVEDNLY